MSKRLIQETCGREEAFETLTPEGWDLLWAALVTWELKNGYTPLPSVWAKRGDRREQYTVKNT